MGEGKYLPARGGIARMWASIQSSYEVPVVSHCGGFVPLVFVCMTCALWATQCRPSAYYLERGPCFNDICSLLVFSNTFMGYTSLKGQLPTE